MKNNKGYHIIILFCLCFLAVANVNAQSDWQVPVEANEKLSPFLFDDDMVLEGRVAYENSCTSCHGTPRQDEFTPMSPPPRDPASEQFQAQSDVSMFYKIKTGRGTMPKFADAFADDELLIAQRCWKQPLWVPHGWRAKRRGFIQIKMDLQKHGRLIGRSHRTCPKKRAIRNTAIGPARFRQPCRIKVASTPYQKVKEPLFDAN